MSEGWKLDCGFTNDEAQEAGKLLLELLEFGAQYDGASMCVSCGTYLAQTHLDECVFQRDFEWRDNLENQEDDE